MEQETVQQQTRSRCNLKRTILHIDDSSIVIELKKENSKVHRLSLDRATSAIRDVSALQPPLGAKKIQFSSLLGLLEVKGHKLLVLAKQLRLCCTLQQKDIFSIESVQFIESSREKAELSSEAKVALNQVQSILTRGMYVSFSLDLTLQFIDQRATTRQSFNWAEFMQSRLAEFDQCWRPTVIQGFVNRISIFVQGQKLEMALISRRSVRMGGTRFRARGVSEAGYVANYCETQQIVIYDKFTFHHLQIRGSIPLFWRQQGFSKQIKITQRKQKSKRHFEAYVAQAVRLFESVLMVNLLSQKKGEKKLLQSLEYMIQGLGPELGSRYHYAHYDVHLKCAGSAYYKANSFIEESLGPLIEYFGFTCLDESGRVLTRQRGVVRTNCLDCLDRTNLFQSKVGAFILLLQLKQLGVNLLNNRTHRFKEHLDFFEDLQNPLVALFRKIWVHNGDNISLQYAGTTSTHSAVNLEGKQTIYTMIKHGETSLFRKYRQYSLDDWKQSALELIVGAYNLYGDRTAPRHQDVVDEDQDVDDMADLNKDVMG